MRNWGLLVVAVALAGCAAPREGGLALPAEAVAVSPRPGAAIPVARAHSEVIVRAFAGDGAGGRREVAGADCVLEAPAYAARFASPGRVIVPVPRTGAPALDVTCRAGELAGSARRGVVRGARGWGGAGPWHDPFWGWRDPLGAPYWGPPRSGVSVGVTFGDPGWGWGAPGPRGRAADYYPDVEVELR